MERRDLDFEADLHNRVLHYSPNTPMTVLIFPSQSPLPTLHRHSYFKCPPQAGIFVLATKLTKPPTLAVPDSPPSRSSTPNRPESSASNSSDRPGMLVPGSAAHHAAMAAARITAGSRASQYIGMTASQLTQKKLGRAAAAPPNGAANVPSVSPSTTRSISPAVTPIKTGKYTGGGSPNRASNRHSTSSTTSNGSASGMPAPAFGLRQPGNIAKSSSKERPTLSRRVSTSSAGSGISSPTPKLGGDIPFSQRRFSSSTNSSRPHTPSAPSPTGQVLSPEALVAAASSAVDEEEGFQQKLSRLMGGDASAGADEATLKIHQMQLRVEVLEAENRFLKLENAQNKNTERLFERNILLKRQASSGADEDPAHAEAAAAELEALKKKLDDEKEKWQTEKDTLSDKVNALVREKESVELKARDLEERVAVAEAQSAAASMGRPDTRQSQLQEEMESVHEKVLNLTEVVRAKDRFLSDLTEQVMTLRNEMEGKEREIRRIKTEAEKEKKERAEEVKNAAAAAAATVAVPGISAEELEKVKAELEGVKKAAEKEKVELMGEMERAVKEKETVAKEKETAETAYQTQIKGAEEAHQAKVTELEATVDELKKACMESLELYETTVEVHKADMEALKASVDDERRKVKVLESECEELRKAAVEAIDVYEGTIEELKKEREVQLKDKDAAMERVRGEADALKKEMEELVKASQAGKEEEVEKIRAVWESEKKRLEERIESAQKAVDREREEREHVKVESDKLKEEVKELEKVRSEKTKLEEKLKDTEKDYEEHLNARVRLTEDIRVANEEKQKAEGENRRMVDAKEKVEREKEKVEREKERIEKEKNKIEKEKERIEKEMRDLKDSMEAASAHAVKEAKEYKEKLELVEQQADTLREKIHLQQQQSQQPNKAFEKARADLEAQIVTIKSQHFKQVETLQDEIERLDAHSKMLMKQKEELTLKVSQLESTVIANGRKSTETIRPSTSSSTSKSGRREKELESQIAIYEEQVAGLKHICDDIAKDNAAIHAENKRLMSEYENLSEAHKQVESECLKLMDEVERLHAEGLLGLGVVPPGMELAVPSTEGEEPKEGGAPAPPAAVGVEIAKLQAQLSEKQAQLDKLSVQHSSELRDVRQRYSELERVKQREINALTKDVAELESLVESKIFKEADLEELLEGERKQVKRLREDVNDLKQQVKELSEGSVFGSVANRRRPEGRIFPSDHSAAAKAANGRPRRPSDIHEEDEDKPFCEICEKYGHDIIGCKAVFSGVKGGKINGSRVKTAIHVTRDEDERPFCDNCEEFGLHWTECCPNQDETF
ncbi:hypothetical protein BC938DRAFT_480523 [Jimgerdemannia flammicorona]|uniref:CLIP1 zinc knuckle domain-containing protein n=1 Tax=Jimgerdemannia flammicorona TaxID=994334 RepID=A0A433QID1_9FUNG|nr:hypothetical protein BC938DRAFT_480523 [Jimgerdemannia flammicorona]